MKTHLSLSALVAVCLLPLASCGSQKATDPTEAKIDSLLTQMTLDEKIGQMNQLTGMGVSDDMKQQIKEGKVGSILNEVDVNIINELQRVAVEESRLHIPLIFGRDVIHGYKTIFPIPLGQAASWNTELAEEGARIAAQEAASVGIRWTFAPMVDVSRDPRWGRIAESCGEDPYMNAVFGAAMVRGFQGKNLSDKTSMAACAKHFAGYGASESGKDYNTTWIPETQLRDVYLPSFQAAVDAGVATFMCSFNDINGMPSSGNKHLNRDILRQEWQFDGMLVSDWGSIDQMISQGVCATPKEAAQKGMPIYAECGGYMYLMEALVDFDGHSHPMAGVFAGQAVMTKKLQMVGYVEAELKTSSVLGMAGQTLHGHEFHFSVEEEPAGENKTVRPFQFTKLRNGQCYPAGQVRQQALGSYLHLHFAGCPAAAEQFVGHCRRFQNGQQSAAKED